jgi:uncharacterized protein (DUF952 family)
MSAPTDDNDTTIYKILTIDQWEAFQASGVFSGNDMDQDDGYLHMSYRPQVDKTHQKFFGGRHDGSILLLHVNTDLLDDKGTLRPEANRPGGDVYPHIYGTIPLRAVVKTEPL